MSGEKQFKPSKKKLDKARKDGKVAKAKEISNFVHLLVLFGALKLLSNLGNELSQACHKVMRVRDWETIGDVQGMLEDLFKGVALQVILFLVTLFLLTLIVELSQVGLSISFKRVELKLTNLSPLGGLKKIFGEREGMKAPLGLAFSILDLILFCTVGLVIMFSNSVGAVSKILNANLDANLAILFLDEVTGFLSQFLILAMIFAVYKYAMSYRRLNKELMMDIEELKQESKEDEGDPHMKGHRKSVHQEVMLHGTIQNVRRAKVLVVSE